MTIKFTLGEKVLSKGRTLQVSQLDLRVIPIVRDHLIEVARAGDTETYGDLKTVLDLPYPPNGLGRLLDLLSEDCIRRGEPSLAALVVTSRVGEVGSAFEGDPVRERAALTAYWAPR